MSCGQIGLPRIYPDISIWAELTFWLFFITPGAIYSGLSRLNPRCRLCKGKMRRIPKATTGEHA